MVLLLIAVIKIFSQFKAAESVVSMDFADAGSKDSFVIHDIFYHLYLCLVWRANFIVLPILFLFAYYVYVHIIAIDML